ncbi:MAG: deoxyribodipyrimidine photo-lyase [Candidatus Sumerlaeota bacterium]|nr:deoxyribodipyrimidine photo-lyase [Candidatus Sumerlaeota bacterium]
MPTLSPIIVWFRRDLRLADNPALREAVDRGAPVVPVYIHAPEEEAPWSPGGASQWWLHHALARLAESLEQRGSRLIVRRGPSEKALLDLARETGATAVCWNRLYDPGTLERDKAVKLALRASGIEAFSRNAALLFEPWTIQTGTGDPYKVFTPFWRRCLQETPPPHPIAKPHRVPAPAAWPESVPLGELGLLPAIKWDAGFCDAWTPGEDGAHASLRRFAGEHAAAYGNTRNRPDLAGTSRLSPHLHFGEIGPRQVWHTVARDGPLSEGVRTFLAEIGWREFAHHLLFHYPRTTHEPLRPEFSAFPWRTAERDLAAWQQGRTGYPIVDAGMRELWATGWMHNRVRMIVASFLVKHLLLPWNDGAAWFWDTLVDADLAANTLGWQWSAGCGADAAPYFRVFNPILQGAKFDPKGEYVRRWVPEIAALPGRHLFAPWEAPAGVLDEARVRLGTTYPHPLVEHPEGRARALAAFETIRKN